MTSAEESDARRLLAVIICGVPPFTDSVSVNAPLVLAETLALIESPALIVIGSWPDSFGYISYQAEYVGIPFLQFALVPICSTVLLVSPSRPTQNDENEFSPAAHVTAGCVQEAEMSW